MKKFIVLFSIFLSINELSFCENEKFKENFLAFNDGKNILFSSYNAKLVMGQPEEEAINIYEKDSKIVELWYKNLYIKYYDSPNRHHAVNIIAKKNGIYGENKIKIGETNINEIIILLGNPESKETINANEVDTKISYSNRIKNKTCSLFFKNNILVYISWNFWD